MGYGAAGVDLFTGLLDTPGSYSGQGTKIPKVKSAEDGLEFTPMSKFTKTKVFEGSSASPATWYYEPYAMVPYWQKVAEGRLDGFGAIIVSDNLYVFGGRYYGQTTDLCNDCYRLNLTTEKWSKLALLPAPCYNIAGKMSQASHNNGKIYWGVTNNQDYKKLLVYDITSNNWTAYDLPTISGTWYTVACCACSDYLYIVIRTSSAPEYYFYSFDYTAHTFTPLTTPPGKPSCLGKISDEVYLVITDHSTYKYNKGTTNWDDTGQTGALTNPTGASNDEDENAMWVVEQSVTSHRVYRYTPGGGWVLQFTNTRITHPWGHCLIPSGYTTELAYFVFYYNGTEQGESFRGGAIARYESSAVWKLLSQTFNQGDLMIINEMKGVPVVCELNGVIKFIAEGLNTIYVIDIGTYLFSLSKKFDYSGVDIYRSVWG